MTVGGQFLDNVKQPIFTGDGVTATFVEHWKPLTQKQFNDLREELQNLQTKRAASARLNQKKAPGGAAATGNVEDERRIAEIRKKIVGFQRRPQNPGLAEKITLKLTLAMDARPGTRELRLLSPLGLSNPLVFQVGDLAEASEKEPAPLPAVAGFRRVRNADEPPDTGPEPEASVTLPACLNGRIMPGDVDRFRFRATKGQDLVFNVSARALIPYLADAVPGWFQATLALFDSKGKEVAYDDDFRFDPDPVLHVRIPADGEYVLEIKDAIFRGREDFVYRITAGQLPFITGVFPLGQQAGVKTGVELAGWNLPEKRLEVNFAANLATVGELNVKRGTNVSNRVPFAVDDLPEILEEEPNNTPRDAPTIAPDAIINGRISDSDDVDVFAFSGRAGQQIAAEVMARRLNSPLDSVLKLIDAAGRKIAFNDDCQDRAAGLHTHHADSWLIATLPENGTYYVQVSDTQRQGGPEYAYRLRVSRPFPDFALRVAPASVTVRAGGTVPLTVYAMRKDGFTNAIRLALADAPRGFFLSGAEIPSNQDQVRLTLSGTTSSPTQAVSIRLEGRAIVDGKSIVRPVVPAEDMEQAFAYHHLVPAQALQVAFTGRWAPRVAPTVAGNGPVKIPCGGTARVELTTRAAGPLDRLQFELTDPPDGITLKSVKPTANGAEILLESDVSKAKPGLRGNLIVSVYNRSAAGGKKKAPAGQVRRIGAGVLPAIPFEIIAP